MGLSDRNGRRAPIGVGYQQRLNRCAGVAIADSDRLVDRLVQLSAECGTSIRISVSARP
jgi:hypothetical protein